MTLKEALEKQAWEKQRLLDARKFLIQAREDLKASTQRLAESEAVIPKAQTRYLEAVQQVKALLDAEVSGVMGHKVVDTPSSEAAE